MKTEYILFAIWTVSTFICLFDLFKNHKESYDDPIEGVDQGSLIFVCIFPISNTIMGFSIVVGWIKNKINPKTRDQMIDEEVTNLIVRQKIYNPYDTYESKVKTATRLVDERLSKMNKTIKS